MSYRNQDLKLTRRTEAIRDLTRLIRPFVRKGDENYLGRLVNYTGENYTVGEMKR